MKTALAAASLLASVLLLSFFGLCAAEAVSLWGVREAALEMFYPFHNAILFIPCLTFGVLFFAAGIAIFASRPSDGRLGN